MARFIKKSFSDTPDEQCKGSTFKNAVLSVGYGEHNLPEIVITLQNLPGYYTNADASTILDSIIDAVSKAGDTPFGSKQVPNNFVLNSGSRVIRFQSYQPQATDFEIAMDVIKPYCRQLGVKQPTKLVFYDVLDNLH